MSWERKYRAERMAWQWWGALALLLLLWMHWRYWDMSRRYGQQFQRQCDFQLAHAQLQLHNALATLQEKILVADKLSETWRKNHLPIPEYPPQRRREHR